MRARIATTLIVVTVGAAGAGCGGSTPVTTTTPYAEANRICREVASRFDDLQADAPRSFEQGEQLLSALAAAADDGERAMGEISPPALQALAFQHYLKSRAKVGDLLQRGLQAARDEDGQGYERVREAANAASGERHRLAIHAGLPGCAAAEGG